MTRLSVGHLILLTLLLAGCAEEKRVVVPPPPEGWPNVECPMGSGITAEARLTAIEGWAGAAQPDARDKARDCKAHTGINEVHCAKVYAAWTAAKATQQQGLSPEQRMVLWAVCTSELTHDTSGAGVLAAGAPRWPDVECPLLSGIMARQRLEQIIAWAGGAYPEAKTKAIECRDTHDGVNDLHRERVYAAWVYASAAQSPGLEPPERDVLWMLCVSELTHDTTGGGLAGGG